MQRISGPTSTRKVEKLPTSTNPKSIPSNCLVCGTKLLSSESRDNGTYCHKIFNSFCVFLDLSLSGDLNWDFEVEKFPFCKSCVAQLEKLSVWYDELETVHAKVARTVRKIKRLVRKSKANKDDSYVLDKNFELNHSCGLQQQELYDKTMKLRLQLQEGAEGEVSGSDESLPDSASAFDSQIHAHADVIPSRKANAEVLTVNTLVKKGTWVDERNTIVQAEKDKKLSHVFDDYVNQQILLLQNLGNENSGNESEVEIPLSAGCDEGTDDGHTLLETKDNECPRMKEEIDSCSLDNHSSRTMTSAEENGKLLTKGNVFVLPPIRLPVESTPVLTSIPTITREQVELRLNKLIQVSRPAWYVSHTTEGFSYGGFCVKAKGTTYICILCEKTMDYCSQEKIIDHLESQHLGKDHWYPCEFCTDEFRLVGQLHRHMRFQHLGKTDRTWTYSCIFCNKRFYDDDLVQKHNHQAHGVQAPARHVTCSKTTPTTTSKAAAKSPQRISGPRELRPRSTDRPKRKPKPSTAGKNNDVICIDLSSDTDSSDSKGFVSPSKARKKAKKKTKKSRQESVVMKMETVVAPLLSSKDSRLDLLNKSVLCGGCGSRYFVESESVIKTIADHFSHHLVQRALACRICCECYCSLTDMIAHVRQHYNTPKYANFVFYCPQTSNQKPDTDVGNNCDAILRTHFS